jgi:hypothetical protein
MKLLKAMLIGSAALGLATGSALAVGDKPSFRSLDTNHDRSISKSEAAAYPELATKFDQADKNHDGKLSRTEYSAAVGKEKVKGATKQRGASDTPSTNPSPKGG